MLRKLNWQISGELSAARYNWCLGQVPGSGPAVEKHWHSARLVQYYIHSHFPVIFESIRFTNWNLISGFHRALLQSITFISPLNALDYTKALCTAHTHTHTHTQHWFKITLPNTEQAYDKHQWTTTNFSQVQLYTPWWSIAYDPKHVWVILNFMNIMVSIPKCLVKQY